MIIIRPILFEDAEAFLNLQLALDAETPFMMFEPGEREVDVKKTAALIGSIKKSGEIFLAEENENCIGYLSLQREVYWRNKHNAYIVIGIRQAFWGQGVGTRLFQSAEIWARAAGAIHRLELTVMAHNISGVTLYKKMGFEVEGLKRHSLWVGGQYVDEYYMAKLLD